MILLVMEGTWLEPESLRVKKPDNIIKSLITSGVR
jgi:hypothetical protein